MTTAYTSLLGLALPVTGELSGTWGDTVNDYITAYLDAAIAGAQTISGSQTAVTLSKTTGSGLSQAGSGATGSSQYQIINCTGNPAGLLTITVPAASKVYLVINATSTNQSVKVVGAGPTTGVTILAGEKALIAWNGSDFVNVSGPTLASDNTWTGTQTFTDAKLRLLGSSTGYTTFDSANSSGTNYTLTVPAATDTMAVLGQNQTFSGTNTFSGANTFSGTNTFGNASGQTFLASTTTTQDGVVVNGRAGGSSSYRVTLAPTTLTASRAQTLPDAAGTVVLDTATQTLTNKTIDAASNTLTGVVTLTGTQTLTNKTLTSPTITSPTLSGTLAGNLTFSGSNTFGNASGQIFLASTTTTQDGIIVNGRAGGSSSYRVTLAPTTLTASRAVTLPDAAGTMVLDAATQTLTNKTVSVDNNTISGIAASSFVLSNSSGNIDGAASQKAIPSGVVVGTTDTQTLTNKTLDAPTINNGYTEEVYAIPSSTTPALSPSNASIQTWSLTGTSTPTAGTWSSGQSIVLMVTGNGNTVTWTSLPVQWKTDGGLPPTLNPSEATAIVLWKVGTTIYGARVGDA